MYYRLTVVADGWLLVCLITGGAAAGSDEGGEAARAAESANGANGASGANGTTVLFDHALHLLRTAQRQAALADVQRRRERARHGRLAAGVGPREHEPALLGASRPGGASAKAPR